MIYTYTSPDNNIIINNKKELVTFQLNKNINTKSLKLDSNDNSHRLQIEKNEIYIDRNEITFMTSSSNKLITCTPQDIGPYSSSINVEIENNSLRYDKFIITNYQLLSVNNNIKFNFNSQTDNSGLIINNNGNYIIL